MLVKVLFFGQLKEFAGCTETALELPEPASLNDIFQHYSSLYPQFTQLSGSIVLARNHQFCSRSTGVEDGDEIAFLPPVSGGSDYVQQVEDGAGNLFALTRTAIDTRALQSKVVRPSDGAIVAFEGVVRNHTKGRATKWLDYECYEAMAVKMMASIGGEIAAAHAIGRISMVHRLGRMQIGEASVVIIVTAPHRKAAFAAALEGINKLKLLVPIWKKEYFADGEVWVEGEWDDSVSQHSF